MKNIPRYISPVGSLLATALANHGSGEAPRLNSALKDEDIAQTIAIAIETAESEQRQRLALILMSHFFAELGHEERRTGADDDTLTRYMEYAVSLDTSRASDRFDGVDRTYLKNLINSIASVCADDYDILKQLIAAETGGQ